MRDEIDIEYPADRMAANRKRWVAWKKYEYADRVRVQAGVETRDMLAARGVTWPDYMDNVEDHYYHQILNHKFVLERYKRIWSIHPGERHFHMCGKMGHLLDIMRDEYHIDEFWGFGYQVPAEEVGRELGGYCRLLGNLDPMLIHSGPVEEIRQAALHCLQVLAPYGGHSLCDGYNLPPGTPVEHIQAMVAAAEDYGKPEITKGPVATGTRRPPQNPPLEMAFH